MSEKLTITILVDGEPAEKSYPWHMKVEEVIKDLLPAGEKGSWAEWMVKMGELTLDPAKSLEENGVRSGAVLALAKKKGGGGNAR